jgi:hypothetical protein
LLTPSVKEWIVITPIMRIAFRAFIPVGAEVRDSAWSSTTQVATTFQPFELEVLVLL